jgi:hypothetical protein
MRRQREAIHYHLSCIIITVSTKNCQRLNTKPKKQKAKSTFKVKDTVNMPTTTTTTAPLF